MFIFKSQSELGSGIRHHDGPPRMHTGGKHNGGMQAIARRAQVPLAESSPQCLYPGCGCRSDWGDKQVITAQSKRRQWVNAAAWKRRRLMATEAHMLKVVSHCLPLVAKLIGC